MTTATAIGVDFSLNVLGSGSSGNCSVISHGDTHLLIDAGFSAKQIGIRLEQVGLSTDQLTAILLTHEHSDHIQSAHTLSRRLQIPILATEGTFAHAIQGKSFFDWVELHAGRSVTLGAMEVHPISLPHDAADPVGFRVECEDRKLAHITDFGYASGLVMESLRGCDTLMIEANHDLDMLKEGPYPWPLKQRIASRLGHLSNDGFLEMVEEVLHDDVQHLVIGHMSRTNNDPRLLTLKLKRLLKHMGLSKIPFTIADQDSPTETFRI